MRKVIAAINTTVDGFCDHTALSPDEEIHRHYTDLLNEGDAILYGRKTFQLMQYWQPLVKKPSGEKEMDDFAVAIDRIPKVVFSKTLKDTHWETAKIATRELEDEVLHLKNQKGRDIFVGSPGLIVSLSALGLIDEYQLCVHPVVAGDGLPLFNHLKKRMEFQLLRTKGFKSGAILLYYRPCGNYQSD